LTPEETRILDKLAEGHVYRTAAAELGLSAREIGLRMKRVYDKVHLLAGAEHGAV
jgi:DNA-binding NarL/FixJ family response regulator